MSLHRTKATIIGLLEASRVNEWIVTEKLGDALKSKPASKTPKKPRFRIGERYAFYNIFTLKSSNVLYFKLVEFGYTIISFVKLVFKKLTGFIYLSLELELISSSVAVMMFSLGKTTSSYSFTSKQ